jgi:hypothetical protein
MGDQTKTKLLNNKSFALFGLLLLLLVVNADPEQIELINNKELKNQTIETATDYKYYKFKIDSGFSGDKDITIKTGLREEHPWSNPDIYIARDAKYPNASHSQIGKLAQNPNLINFI